MSELERINVKIDQQRSVAIEADKQCQGVQLRLEQLHKQENELLAPNYSPGCKLIDAQGFPIAVDLYAVRQCRNETIHLQNDLKELENKLEIEMLKTFQLISLRDDLLGGDHGDENQQEDPSTTTTTSHEVPFTSPFLRIDLVLDGTPAHNAGLADGDQILLFGEINYDIFQERGLSDLSNFISANQNHPIKVIYLHHETFSIQSTELTPRQWQGQGLLGCKVVPIF